jgi:glycerol uptake facilitator-like aquaporin
MSSLIPVLILLLAFIAPAIASFYYGAIVSGVYKDPLMARFRVYGDEQRPPFLSRFLVAVGAWLLVFSVMITVLFIPTPTHRSANPTPVAFSVLAFMVLTGSAIAYFHPTLRELLPRWYFDLLRTTTRQERRRIAYAWLRLPARLRWRLNGNPAAFRVWVELVLLTVIYGAHDPDSPWDVWT